MIEIGARTGDSISNRRNTLSGEEKPWVLGWPNLADKNTGCPGKFEFQINTEYIFSIIMSHIWHV